MIGILIVTHKELAEALISVWDLILGRGEGVQAVSLDPNDAPEVSRQKIQRALSQVNNGSGVIILTDMLVFYHTEFPMLLKNRATASPARLLHRTKLYSEQWNWILRPITFCERRGLVSAGRE